MFFASIAFTDAVDLFNMDGLHRCHAMETHESCNVVLQCVW